MMIWIKRAALFLSIIAVAAATFLALRPMPVLVDAATVTRGPVEVTINEEGVTRIEEIYKVSAPIAGKLERLELDVGDEVTKGQRIALVRPVDPPIRDARTMRELRAALKAAEASVLLGKAEVARAQAALKFAETELFRQAELAKRRIVSDRTLQKAELEADTRRAQLLQSKANLELRLREHESAQARAMEPSISAGEGKSEQCCVEILAPASGSILKLHTRSEQVVGAGAALLEIGDTENIEIVVDLLSSDAVKVKEGDPVWIERWGGKDRLAGKVRRVDPSGFTKVSALGIEEQRVNTIIDFTEKSLERKRLGNEFQVYVRIVVWREKQALRIPLGALFRKGGDWATFKLEDGLARIHKVRLGQRDDRFSEVLNGLTEGDKVIVHPSDRVSDGKQIEIRALE